MLGYIIYIICILSVYCMYNIKNMYIYIYVRETFRYHFVHTRSDGPMLLVLSILFLIDLKTLKTERLQNPRFESCGIWFKNIKNIKPKRLLFLMILMFLIFQSYKSQIFVLPVVCTHISHLTFLYSLLLFSFVKRLVTIWKISSLILNVTYHPWIHYKNCRSSLQSIFGINSI